MAKKSGTSGNDKLIGTAGDDLLVGGGGNDFLSGGAGDDRLEGGDGNDYLSGGKGGDHLIGGAGHDLLRGDAGNDVLEGGAGNDYLSGGAGDDHLIGGAGRDLLNGGSGNDLLEGGSGDDLLCGGQGNDVLEGGAGTDLLYGGQGDDVLEGGAGNDYLFGGEGNDLFIYRTGDGSDQVNGGGGIDTIRLHVDDGWALKLTKGKIVSDADGQMQLSGSAAGTITLADGGTIRFKSIERIETVASEPDADHPLPMGLTLQAGPVDENAPDGSVVGTAVTTGPDAAGGAPGAGLTYSLTDDAGGRFAIDPATGVITVADGAALDYESAKQHGIEVKVTAAAGLSATQAFTIEVADVNEAPGIIGLDSSEVAENAAAGTVVGTVSASDPDAGDTLTYSLTDDAEGRFAIDPHTGVITVADGAALNHEHATQHGIEVKVTDAAGLSATQALMIQVADVNEAPVIQALSSNQVIEGAVVGTVVGTVSAIDPDLGDVLSYALSDDAGGRFAIDPTSGVVTVADGSLLDHDAAAQHGITVEVTDAQGLSDSVTYVIDLQKDNSGNDTLLGSPGDDVLDGGPGDDVIFGGNGDDHLIGGSGSDDLNGDAGDDLLEGGAGDDFLFGGDGNDQLFGGDGNDQLFGGSGDDRIAGGDGDDFLFGGDGNDQLLGGDGNDQLFGGPGNDVLAGGGGDDMLFGEGGADRFVFASPDEGVDRVMDFSAGDVLAIGEMLVGFAAGDEAAFVRLLDDGTDTTVQVDIDGAANGESYQSIAVLNGITGISLADLVSAGQIDFWMS